jgi:hypothetical protein
MSRLFLSLELQPAASMARLLPSDVHCLCCFYYLYYLKIWKVLARRRMGLSLSDLVKGPTMFCSFPSLDISGIWQSHFRLVALLYQLYWQCILKYVHVLSMGRLLSKNSSRNLMVCVSIHQYSQYIAPTSSFA